MWITRTRVEFSRRCTKIWCGVRKSKFFNAKTFQCIVHTPNTEQTFATDDNADICQPLSRPEPHYANPPSPALNQVYPSYSHWSSTFPYRPLRLDRRKGTNRRILNWEGIFRLAVPRLSVIRSTARAGRVG